MKDTYDLQILGIDEHEATTSLTWQGRTYYLDFETLQSPNCTVSEAGIFAVRHGLEGLIDNVYTVTLDWPMLSEPQIRAELPHTLTYLENQSSLFPRDQEIFFSFVDLDRKLNII